jgi:hypothetical protein
MVGLDFILCNWSLLPIKITVRMKILSLIFSVPAFSQSEVTDGPILDLYNGQKIEIFIEGQSVTAFVAPGMPSNLTISNTLARSIFGKGANRFASPFEQFVAALAKDEFDNAPPRYIQKTFGPVKIRGQQRLATIGSQGSVNKQLVQWYQSDIYEFGDALAGPYAISAPVIRFTLRLKQPGETRFSMPLTLDKDRWLASSPLVIGKKKVYFAFAPQFETTLASAGAGAMIAQDYGGEFAGDPQPVMITHNIARPARPVQLKTPIMFGPIALSKLLVRSRDYGNTDAIKRAKSLDESEEDEILVQANRKGTKPEYFVYVGNDVLKNCSSITYDKPEQMVTLSCLPPN